MHRKFHNSLTALLASLALVSTVVLLGAPRAPATSSALPVPAPAYPDSGDTPAASSPAASSPAAMPPAGRRAHPSVRMPFFSFFLPRS